MSFLRSLFIRASREAESCQATHLQEGPGCGYTLSAALSLNQRGRLVSRVIEHGWPLTKAAEAAEVRGRTASKSVRRYRARGRAGAVGLLLGTQNVVNRTDERRIEAITALRRLRFLAGPSRTFCDQPPRRTEDPDGIAWRRDDQGCADPRRHRRRARNPGLSLRDDPPPDASMALRPGPLSMQLTSSLGRSETQRGHAARRKRKGGLLVPAAAARQANAPAHTCSAC